MHRSDLSGGTKMLGVCKCWGSEPFDWAQDKRWLSSETYRNQASGVACITRLVSIRRGVYPELVEGLLLDRRWTRPFLNMVDNSTYDQVGF